MLKKVEREPNIWNFSHPEIFREVFIGNKRWRFSANYFFSQSWNKITVTFYKYAFVSVNKHGKDHITYSVWTIWNIPQEIILGVQDRFEKLWIVTEEEDVTWRFYLEELKTMGNIISRTVEDILSGSDE